MAKFDTNIKENLITDPVLYAKNTFDYAEEYIGGLLQIPRSKIFDYVNFIAFNLAFACELYLKCIDALEHSRIPDKGHYLKALYNRLEKDTQEKIKMKCVFPHDRNASFELILRELNNSFEYYRYANEITEHVVLFENLTVFTIAVKEVAEQIIKQK